MIKTTSKLKIWTARLAVIPVLAALLLLFSMKSISEVHKFKPIASGDSPKTEETPQKETFFKGATIWIENKDGKYIPRKYDEMTATEKAALPAPMLPKVSPTNELFTSWKTQPDTYAIWIDGKYINNSALAKYKADDFLLYRSRTPGAMDLRVNKNYGKFSYLVNLYSKNGYAEQYLKPYNKPGKWVAVYKGQVWPAYSDGADLIRRYFEFEKLKTTNPNSAMKWVLPPFKPEKME